MAFVPSQLSTLVSLDPKAAHKKIEAVCAKHAGNLTYVAAEVGVARWTVLRWVLKFIALGMTDPRGDFKGAPIKQRRVGGRTAAPVAGRSAGKKAGKKIAKKPSKTPAKRKTAS